MRDSEGAKIAVRSSSSHPGPSDKPDEYAELERFLPKVQDPAEFRNDVMKISLWLYQDLAGAERIAATQNIVSIKKAERALQKALVEIRKLSDETKAILLRRLNPDANNRRVADGVKADEFGRQLATSLHALAETRVALNAHVSKGRRKMIEADEAMIGLIEIWEKQVGKKPTIATDSYTGMKNEGQPFLAFCGAVIRPIYISANREVPAIAPLAQKILYPSNT
jgi:hypothetical protein